MPFRDEPRDGRDRAVWVAVAVLAAIAYSLTSIYRHDHFGSAAFDLGVYDQLIWGYSRFQILFNTVSLIPNLLGDHFHPILMALAPLYWIWNDVRALLIAQAILLASASIPIFWFARQHLGLLEAALIQLAYLIFWGILAGNMFDFHQLAVAVPAVSFALYGAITRQNLMLLPAVAIGLLSKEDVALTFVFLGLYLVLTQKRWRTGLLLASVAAGYFWVVIKLVIPYIRGGSAYGHWTYGALGATPEAAIKHLLTRPWDAVIVAIKPIDKLQLVGALLGAWLFFPLVSPIFIVAIPLVAERVWSDKPEFWSTQFHYSMVIAPVLAFATVDTLARVRERIPASLRSKFTAVSAAGVLLAGVVCTWVINPLEELGEEVSGAQAAQIQSCLNTVPASASVAATAYLVPHLSHRTQIFTLPAGSDRVEYVAVGAGQNEEDLMPYINQAQQAGFEVGCTSSLVTVLKRP